MTQPLIARLARLSTPEILPWHKGRVWHFDGKGICSPVQSSALLHSAENVTNANISLYSIPEASHDHQISTSYFCLWLTNYLYVLNPHQQACDTSAHITHETSFADILVAQPVR